MRIHAAFEHRQVFLDIHGNEARCDLKAETPRAKKTKTARNATAACQIHPRAFSAAASAFAVSPCCGKPNLSPVARLDLLKGRPQLGYGAVLCTRRADTSAGNVAEQTQLA